MTITTPGTIIDGMDIRGAVYISANDVTVRRSRITAGSDWALIQIKPGVTGTVVEDVDLIGAGRNGAVNSSGIVGAVTVLRTDISGVENGVVPHSGSVVRSSYIHDLGAPGSPHYDGVQIDGGIRNVVVDGNNVDLGTLSQTSAVMIDNYFGPIDNITVSNNRLHGGGYTVYSDGQFSGGPITNVSFINNRLGRGYWGYASIVGNTPVWRNNVDDTTGSPVSAR